MISFQVLLLPLRKPNFNLINLGSRVRKFYNNAAVFDHQEVNASKRRIPFSPQLQDELIHQPPEKLNNSRLLKVAVLGVPNAGKSTLVNQLVGWKTCAVSNKVHTTRKASQSVYMYQDTQIIFLDTPGLVGVAETKQHNLESSFLIDPEKALINADLLIILHDVSNKWTRERLNKGILRLLYLYPQKKSILVMNKTDLLKDKRSLLELLQVLTENIVDNQPLIVTPAGSKTAKRRPISINLKTNNHSENAELKDMKISLKENLTETEVARIVQNKIGWPHFSRVFMISALHKEGLAEIQNYFLETAQPAKWVFNSNVVTDQNPHDIAVATIREKLLNELKNEIPYKLNVSVEYWEMSPAGSLNVVMRIDCYKENLVRLIIGSKGGRIMKMARESEQDFRNIFRCDVRLSLNVQSQESSLTSP